MSDAQSTAASPPGLFFAGSDDEGEAIPKLAADEDDLHQLEPVPSSVPQTPTKPPANSNLFFAASDEDEAAEALLSSLPKAAYKPIATDDFGDIETVDVSAVTAPLPQESIVCEATEKRLEEPPKKKRRISPAAEAHPHSLEFPPTYLGDVLVENAWSTVSGKGYVKPGESVIIQRDGPNDGSFGSGAQKGKSSDKTKKTGGKKQATITSMLRPQTRNLTRKKVNTVVRIVNKRGFGIVFP